MNNEKQRIAIAEACGIVSQDQWGSLYKTPHGIVRDCPDYTQDLNAMHSAEKVLLGDQRIAFLDELLDVLGLEIGPGGWDMDFISVWQMTRATAAQRAEAFLKTLGKWEEEA